MKYLGVVTLLMVSGCAGHRALAPDLLPPDVTLTQVAMRNFGLTGGTLDATVAIRNPNGVPIRGTGILLNLNVQGHRFGTTDWSRGYELAADSTVIFVVPVDFTWRTAGLAARNVLNTGDVRYEISGRTYLLIAGENWRFPYARQGSVPLVRVP